MNKITNPKTDGATLYDGQFREFSEEQVGLRVIEIDDRKFNIVQENPWNLWKIIPDKGKIPEALAGKYTSIMLAEQAITLYLNKKNGAKVA